MTITSIDRDDPKQRAAVLRAVKHLLLPYSDSKGFAPDLDAWIPHATTDGVNVSLCWHGVEIIAPIMGDA